MGDVVPWVSRSLQGVGDVLTWPLLGMSGVASWVSGVWCGPLGPSGV